MTADQVQPIIARVRAHAERTYPSEFGGSRALVSPNLSVQGVQRPAGDVHVGNVEQTQELGPRYGWSQLRQALTGDGFTVVDCGCGVYRPNDCFVVTASAS